MDDQSTRCCHLYDTYLRNLGCAVPREDLDKHCNIFKLMGRDGEIRTRDPLNPIQGPLSFTTSSFSVSY